MLIFYKAFSLLPVHADSVTPIIQMLIMLFIKKLGDSVIHYKARINSIPFTKTDTC